MKKDLFIIATLLTFLVFSCASDSELDDNNLNDDILAPVVTSENLSNEDNINSNEDLLPSELLPEPLDFEEPLVRDLDIEYYPKNFDENILVSEVDNKTEEEPVIEIAEKPVTEMINNTNVADEKNTTTVADLLPKEEKKDSEKTTSNQTPPVAIANSETKKNESAKTVTNNQAEQKKSDNVSNQNKTAETKVSNQKEIVEEEKLIVPLIEKEVEKIIPSRKVTVNTNETLTITYPGYGWIYLGSESENNNLVSTGRKVENEETVYTLTAKRAGTQLQHFYKVDTITGNFIDDWIEVEVLDNKGSVYTIVKAPDYAEVVPERPEVPAVASAKKTVSTSEILEKEVKPTEKRSYETYVPEPEVVNTTVTEQIIPKPAINDYTENLSADDLLKKAQSLFDEKQFSESQKYVNNFMEIATHRRDEGLFLQGQIFEQDGVTKNIKESIASYTTLVENFPESDLWDAANKRIIYLNRFYIQIR